MKYRRRIYYSAEQRAEIWDRWQRKIVNTDPPNPVFAFNQNNQLLPKPSQIY